MSGSLGGGTGRFKGTMCARGAGPEDIYSLHVSARTGVMIRDTSFTGTPGLSFSIRRTCDQGSTEISCAANLDANLLRAVHDPGDYFVVVDSDDPLNYSLSLTAFTAAPNATCAGATPLPPTSPRNGEDISTGAGSGTVELCLQSRWSPRLYYSVTVPPNGTATVTATATSTTLGWWPLLQVLDGCPATTCTASSDGDGGVTNAILVTNGASAPERRDHERRFGAGARAREHLRRLRALDMRFGGPGTSSDSSAGASSS
jgi:hypothetical protein